MRRAVDRLNPIQFYNATSSEETILILTKGKTLKNICYDPIETILYLSLEVPSRMIKKIENFAPPPWDAPGKKYIFLHISLNKMEILIFMFDRLISFNKENRNPPPLGLPWQKNIFWISLINMEILIFIFDCLIYNNKENKNFPPPWYASDNFSFSFSIYFNKYKIINIYISLVSISYNIRDNT